MILHTNRWLLPALLVAATTCAGSQVFVVGEKSATSELKTDFTPTTLQLPDNRLTERGRRDLIRNLDAEQAFAHRALPMGPGLTLQANGPLSPSPEAYRRMIYEKGQAAGPGDRVAITAMVIKGDRIIFDLNGGPYAKHRWLSHLQFNDNNVVANPDDKPTGARITLVFEGGLPEISAPEVKALLEPLLDFGVKSSEQAYADTLPAPLKDAIASHDVLVGMTHRMVLAALGAPESKVREQASGDASGTHYEEWIYGHVPQTVRFVRFKGDRVTLVEIAALGKPMEIHNKDEMAGYAEPAPTHEVALGDVKPDSINTGATPGAPPSLRRPDEPVTTLPNSANKVQFPEDRKSESSKPMDSMPTDSMPTNHMPTDHRMNSPADASTSPDPTTHLLPTRVRVD